MDHRSPFQGETICGFAKTLRARSWRPQVWHLPHPQVPRPTHHRVSRWLGHTKLTTTDTYLNATTQLLYELQERNMRSSLETEVGAVLR
jgi:hypothetical protein